MFDELESINERPEPFQFYTAIDLWTDEYTSAQMLACHLNDATDLASRNAEFIGRSVEWIASRFDLGKATRVADFGCGPGLYATRLARRGARVTGIDVSTRSIEYAKQAAASERLPINYVTQNYLDYDTEDRFGLILMIGCDFCALSPLQRSVILSKFYKFLEPGGSVLLDVHSPAAFDQRQETATYDVNLLNGFWSPNKYYRFLNTFKYAEARVILDKYTIVEQVRTRTVYNWLQYFEPEELEREFLESGLSVEELHSDVAGSQYDTQSSDFAVIARRA